MQTLTRPSMPQPNDPGRLYDAINAFSTRLIGIGITLLVMILGSIIFVVAPYIRSHAAGANVDCAVIIPPNPLSAKGLATPYQLTALNAANGACNEANTDQSAFVQAGIFDPATGQVSIYNPLIIDQGTQPAAPSVVPALPANASSASGLASTATP